MKKITSGLLFGTPEYVVAHGVRQLSRKISLSAILLGEHKTLNPRKALIIARELLKPKKKNIPRNYNARGQTPLEEMLDIPPPHEAPWPGATRVPFTFYN